MYPQVTGELGMKGGGEQVALADHHRVTVHGGQHLHPRSGPVHPGGADEHPVHRPLQAFHLEVTFEGIHLPAERVAIDDHVQHTQLGLRTAPVGARGQEDHAGAGAQRGQAAGDGPAQGLEQAVALGQRADGGRLPPGDDQGGQALQIARGPHQHRFYPQPGEGGGMLPEVALEGEHPYLHAQRPLVCSISAGSILPISRPAMGAPSPRDTRASTAGSW